jgi:uncharacterized protein YukE
VDFLHADTDVVRQTAQTTGVSADGIMASIAGLETEMGTFLGQTFGAAADALRVVFMDWAQDAKTIVNRVHELRNATDFSANIMDVADETSRAVVNQVAGIGSTGASVGAFQGQI